MGIDIERGNELYQKIRASLLKVIVGLDRAIETVILGLITPGDIHHVMFEGDPGVGKTLLAEATAKVVAGVSERAQGNADLVPQSFTGYWKYLDDVGGRKILKPGIITLKPWQILREKYSLEVILSCDDFTKLERIERVVRDFPVVILYDEANRTNPWANGAVLEAMQEYKVTVDGVSIPLNPSMLWILTRNKLERGQTYELPEAMRSRVAFEDELFPPKEEEAYQLLARDRDLIYQKRALETIEPVLNVDELMQVREYIASEIRVSEAMNHYIIQLVSACLNQFYLRDRLGVRKLPLPNGSYLDIESERFMRTDYPGYTAPGRIMLTLKQISKAAAYIAGSKFVRPEHLKRVFHRAICHHIFVEVPPAYRQAGIKGSTLARAIADVVISSVDEPSSKDVSAP